MIAICIAHGSNRGSKGPFCATMEDALPDAKWPDKAQLSFYQLGPDFGTRVASISALSPTFPPAEKSLGSPGNFGKKTSPGLNLPTITQSLPRFLLVAVYDKEKPYENVEGKTSERSAVRNEKWRHCHVSWSQFVPHYPVEPIILRFSSHSSCPRKPFSSRASFQVFAPSLLLVPSLRPRLVPRRESQRPPGGLEKQPHTGPRLRRACPFETRKCPPRRRHVGRRRRRRRRRHRQNLCGTADCGRKRPRPRKQSGFCGSKS